MSLVSDLRSMSRSRFQLLAVILAIVAAFAGATSEPAHAAPASNQTVLTLDPAIPLALGVAKVQLRTIGAARAGSAGIYLPVTRSSANSSFAGTTRHQGGFELVVGKQLRFGLRNPQVVMRSNGEGSLTAEPVIQGIPITLPLPLGRVTLASVSNRSGFTTATYRLRVEQALAALVNGAVGMNVLPAGQPWATLQTRVPQR